MPLMPILYLAAIIAAIALVLYLLYLAVMYGAPIAAGIAALIAVILVIVDAVGASWSVLRSGAPIDHLDIAPPRGADPGSRDPGYRSYLLGPVVKDIALAGSTASRYTWERTVAGRAASHDGVAQASLMQNIIRMWNGSGQLAPGYEWLPKAFLLAPLVGALVGVAAGAIAGVALAGLTALVFGVMLFVIVLAAATVTVLLRGFEAMSLRLRSITLECSVCHRRVSSPVYDCYRCPDDERARHRRLMPGRLGVLSRTCRCGNSLPTLLVRGKSRLPAYCQHDDCGAPLPNNGLGAPTFHVPVVAGRAAGKSVFMLAAIADLDTKARADGRTEGIEFATEDSREKYELAHAAIRKAAFDGIRATDREQPLKAFNVYLGRERSRARKLLYLYDPAGERFQSSDGIATFRFLGFTAGVVFVVDPFAFADVRRSVSEDLLMRLRHSEDAPADAAGRFTADLRSNLEVRTNRRLTIPAAVVLTKCDALLETASVPHPYESIADVTADPRRRNTRSSSVRAWLQTEAGAGGMVSELENSFRRVAYFAVSALDAFEQASHPSTRGGIPVHNDDPSAPLNWLLGRNQETS